MSTPEEIWAEVAKTYTIHRETLASTSRELKFNFPPSSGLPVEQVRENWQTLHDDANGKSEDTPFNGTTVEIDAGGVPASVYVPDSHCSENPSVVVYFHGGSLMLCSRATHERSLKALAEISGVIVVNVEYRLLPCSEDPMAPFTDAVAATRWVMNNRNGLGGVCTPGSKVGIGGDSAGGQIALGVSNEIKSGLDFMVLVYPTADFNTDLPSCKEFESTPGFNTTALRWRFLKTNGPIPNAESNPTLNAAAREDVGSCPPTVIVLAQLDPLRDAGVMFADRLKAAGVLVRHHVIEGVPHGFFSLPGIYKETTCQAFAYIADFLRKFKS